VPPLSPTHIASLLCGALASTIPRTAVTPVYHASMLWVQGMEVWYLRLKPLTGSGPSRDVCAVMRTSVDARGLATIVLTAATHPLCQPVAGAVPILVVL
jgi:hypothetical protein